MGSKRLKLQVATIFIIVIAAFLGSALFFSYLNTNAMMTAVEKETELSTAMLSTSIHTQYRVAPDDEQTAREDLTRELGKRLPKVLEEAGVEIDLWAVSQSGHILYANSADFPEDEWQRTAAQPLEEDSYSMRWIGRRNPFWLNQSLYLVHRLAGSELYIVVLNHCSAIKALQRSQFALFVSIELVLILTMVVLLTNTFSSYRKLLIQLATTDELTGLANRKSFLSTYADFVKRHPDGDYSLFLVDIDYFKKINDTYGHATGDAALKLLARNIGDVVNRHRGFAGRWGGDEFIGILPLDGEAAHGALDEMCGNVRGGRVEGDVGITISVGAAMAEAGMPLTRLSERADRALYRSKAMGKDRASLYCEADDKIEDVEITVNQTAVAGSAADRRAKDSKNTEAPSSVPQLTLRERVRQYLREKLLPSTLLGVRWMAPFVAGGGILIGFAFLFDAASVNLAALEVAQRANFGSITRVAAMLKTIGGVTFNFMLPVFAGFMAYGLAGENAFMAGFIGGYMTINSNSGFIGAMVAGFAAGMIANQSERFMEHMPTLIRKAAPIIIYPVFNLLLMQAISWLIITPASDAVGRLFTALLDRAVSSKSVFSGALSGAMMALDMGGIVNKVAYNYGVAGLANGQTVVMASVMAGGMIPPLGIALSMVLYRDKYKPEERERGIGTLFMGLSFITEGALPFVFSDVLRVIPACMAGSALAGLLSMEFGCALPAPHGGVFVIPVMEKPILYLLALALGSLVTALLLGMLKKRVDQEE